MWEIETLGTQQGRELFDCGEEDLNDWLQLYAGQQGRTGNTLTRVALDPHDGRIVGYYASQAYRLHGEDLVSAFGAGARKYPIPAILLARLAVCRSVQGEGLGAVLLAHALRACTRVSEDTGLEVVVVHALNQNAAAFYRKFGFVAFVDHPLHLMIPMKTVRKAFPA